MEVGLLILLAAYQMPNLAPEADSSVLQIWGGHPLRGHVKISGAKNSALVIMAGALLCSGDCRIRNVPLLADVERMGQVLSALGVRLNTDKATF